jgi:hypothetical protein
MNPFEQYLNLLKLCPIPEIIQNQIFNLVVGFGTHSANIMRMKKDKEKPYQIVILLGPGEMCCKKLYYWDYRVVNQCYDMSSHFTREALYELHLIYLSQLYNIYQSNYWLKFLMKKRLLQLMEEELRIEY